MPGLMSSIVYLSMSGKRTFDDGSGQHATYKCRTIVPLWTQIVLSIPTY